MAPAVLKIRLKISQRLSKNGPEYLLMQKFHYGSLGQLAAPMKYPTVNCQKFHYGSLGQLA